eukprot:CAMPEP_0202690272 /NCGR_PEP_ID=MMETSP1385-20130828/5300_1 /ASSEMBLY_ACC=CAM_ASM_000861 /TAXON_ID=933848 /ORGANISM="Elphidium margaritaceum" /LENGTH=403 /DNA_ID=CAMNT_0049345509 /DNA_START=35 /DNA_END=1243 /DNA_ORIENTATION=+
MSASSKRFELGDQPEWAGKEPNVDVPASFIDELLQESNAESLLTRGYCVVKLDAQTTAYYSLFHGLIEEFFALKAAGKEKYALLQFEPSNNSPNQCHGYSKVSTLKEQFMMRCIGRNTQSNAADNYKDAFTFPVCGDGNFGKYGMQIYQALDLKCRQFAKEAMAIMCKSEKVVDDILDPVNEVRTDMDENACDNVVQNGRYAYSSFMPNDYISSSIMDNFHYYSASHEKHERFFNNHASHTDSGLMTVVIITDEPGLEIFDQKRNEWIAIERLMQTYLKEDGAYEKDAFCHRGYATFFWSDSVEYLNKAPFVAGKKANAMEIKPLFHRVANCQNERYSVVFKQRTAPLRTHCRYQEDYILASLQQKVDTESKNAFALWKEQKKAKTNGSLWLYATILFVVVSV